MDKNTKLDPDEIISAVERDDNIGFCRSCGNESMNVEPDAEHYPCESCEKKEVFGAQQLLIMGYAGGY